MKLVIANIKNTPIIKGRKFIKIAKDKPKIGSIKIAITRAKTKNSILITKTNIIIKTPKYSSIKATLIKLLK